MGYLEIIIAPFASIHNGILGVLILTVVVLHFLAGLDANLGDAPDPDLVVKIASAVNYLFHVLLTLLISTTLKKVLARPRPLCPLPGAANDRYLKLRSQEHNCSMPSGDTA